MLRAKLIKETNILDRISDSVRKLDGQYTEGGYFRSQGRHISGEYTYAGLAQSLELGIFPVQGITRTPMPFMHFILLNSKHYVKTSPIIKSAVKAWKRKMHLRGNPLIVLNAVGMKMKEEAHWVFGNQMYFPQAPDNDDPLISTGDLLNHFTYRTSWDNRVRRV